jgi:hypothetical protein
VGGVVPFGFCSLIEVFASRLSRQMLNSLAVIPRPV